MTNALHLVELVQLLADTFRPYGWTDRSIDGYVIALGDLPEALVAEATYAACRSATKMPAPAELRLAVLEHVSGRAPDADRAWSEVRTAFGTHGRTSTPNWSHPLIADTIATLGGWGRLCASTDATGDRIAFTRAFQLHARRAERDALIAPALGIPALAGHHIAPALGIPALAGHHIAELGDGD